MNAQRLVCILMLLVIATCCATAHAQSADLIFIQTHGTERIYNCQVNSLRQWPSSVALDDGLFASCDEPIVHGPSPQKAYRLPGNIGDRPWSVTLTLPSTEELYHDCLLVSLGVNQGSTTVSLQCSGG